MTRKHTRTGAGASTYTERGETFGAMLARWRQLTAEREDVADEAEHARIGDACAAIEAEVALGGFERLGEAEIGLEMIRAALADGPRPGDVDVRICDALIDFLRVAARRPTETKESLDARLALEDAITDAHGAALVARAIVIEVVDHTPCIAIGDHQAVVVSPAGFEMLHHCIADLVVAVMRVHAGFHGHATPRGHMPEWAGQVSAWAARQAA